MSQSQVLQISGGSEDETSSEHELEQTPEVGKITEEECIRDTALSKVKTKTYRVARKEIKMSDSPSRGKSSTKKTPATRRVGLATLAPDTEATKRSGESDFGGVLSKARKVAELMR